METKHLVIGQRYLFRRGARYPHKNTSPTVKVTVLLAVPQSRRAKVRHESGDLAGVEEVVPSRQLLCPWRDRKPWLRDERQMERLRERYDSDRIEDALIGAVNVVFEMSGEDSVAGVGRRAIFRGDAEAIGRLMDRAGIAGSPADLDPEFGWVDRDGTYWMSFGPAMLLAKGLAAAEPAAVIHGIEADERRLEVLGYDDPTYHRRFTEARPSHALARRWAGAEQEVALLRAEISRLRALVHEAAAHLDNAGDVARAARLRRRLGQLDGLPD